VSSAKPLTLNMPKASMIPLATRWFWEVDGRGFVGISILTLRIGTQCLHQCFAITCHFRRNFKLFFLIFTTTVWVCMNWRQWFPVRYSTLEPKTGSKWMVCWSGRYLFISAMPTWVPMLQDHLPWCKDGKSAQIFWGPQRMPIQLFIKFL